MCSLPPAISISLIYFAVYSFTIALHNTLLSLFGSSLCRVPFSRFPFFPFSLFHAAKAFFSILHKLSKILCVKDSLVPFTVLFLFFTSSQFPDFPFSPVLFNSARLFGALSPFHIFTFSLLPLNNKISMLYPNLQAKSCALF